jgi:general secretion pathway protein A
MVRNGVITVKETTHTGRKPGQRTGVPNMSVTPGRMRFGSFHTNLNSLVTGAGQTLQIFSPGLCDFRPACTMLACLVPRLFFCYRPRAIRVSASSRPAPPDQLTPCEKFYGLNTPPFSLTPDLRFAYHSHSHTSAFNEIAAALRRREGLIVITGEIGTGKTMLCRVLLDEFQEARTFLSVILDPRLTVDELLHQVLRDFGLISKAAAFNRSSLLTQPGTTTLASRTDQAGAPPSGRPAIAGGPETDATRHQLVTVLHHFLASLIPLNAHAVILIDEAQHLDPAVLEQIRLLSNFETDDAKLLQIVLVGQPDLDAVLRRPDMRQLNQRIARRIELHPLSDSEVADYIARRLTVASDPTLSDGTPSPPLAQFTPSALAAVCQISRGIPRIVNIVCDRSLEAGCALQARTIDRPLVLAAAKRLKLPVPAAAKPPVMTAGKVMTAAAAVLVLGIVGGLWWAQCPPQLTLESRQPSSSRVERPAARSGAGSVNQPAGNPANGDPVGSSGATGAGGESPGKGPESDPPPERGPAGDQPVNDRPAARDLDTAAPPLTSLQDPGRLGGSRTDRYDIVVAAFRTSKRAIEVATDIAAKGLPVTTRADSTGNWYQVIVGPYSSANDAESAQRRLAREGFPDARVSPNVGER